MSNKLAIIIGGIAGVMTLAVLIIFFVWLRICNKRNISRASETNSSEQSTQAEQNIELSISQNIPYPADLLEARSFTLKELSLATNNFNEYHLIGKGMFGEVYKGLLPDMIVAIKKRWAAPSLELTLEVRYLSSIRHRNLVSLLGYCQENDLQMLVYEYIPNGNVSTHLYGSSQISSTRLEFKHRLSIAYGAAKGDLQIQAKKTGNFSEKSDVYSFGVFLLELVSGQEAIQFLELGSIYEWAQNYEYLSDISTLMDHRMGTTFTTEGMRDFFQLAVWCLNASSGRRPPMSFVVSEIERIHEKEMNLATFMGEEGTPVVTLGSQLFMPSSS